MAVHRIPMTDRTREQIVANNAVPSKARKGKDGHSPKCRSFMVCQKYPLTGRMHGTVSYRI